MILLFAASLIGSPIAADGDTLTLNSQRIRLFGIDAVEAEQRCQNDRGEDWLCGGKATQALASLINGQHVECELRDIDQYGRIVAQCRVNGRDVAEQMVAQGWAVAFRKHSNLYVATEEQAQLARVGIWSGLFERPDAYRATGRAQVARSQRASTPQRMMSSSACAIKGNINLRGHRIYHLPNTRWYDATKAEAMFCSEGEAMKAGFRRARSRY